MKRLINLFVMRPVTVAMILCAVLLFAVYSLFSLPLNRLPEISLPRVTVETIYAGMAANEIRSLVTIPLEDALSPVKGLEKIRSISRDNRSLISMDFRWGIDPMTAAVLVREAIDAVYPSLPEGARKPSVTAGDAANEPHAVIAVRSHNGNAAFARNLAEYELRARLRRIDGAGVIVLAGGEVQEEKLSLDVHKLAALGFSPSQFAHLLSQETADIPAGNAKEGNMELIVVSSGKPDSVYELSNIILPVLDGTFSVKDAGHLYPSAARRESAFVYNGMEAVAIEIYRRPGADPLRLSRDIKKTIKEAASAFSRDALVEIVYDSSPSLTSKINGFLISASLAIAVIAAVLFFFIRNLKFSLLSSFAIPFSASAGVCALFVFGKSLNSMSLAGLAMGIGLVSDISVIVLDLLNRSFNGRSSVPKPEEIGNCASSIAGSSAGSTLTTTLVFLPVIFLPGMIGSLFGDIAIALVASVAAGWFYAQFCLPSLYMVFYKNTGFSEPRKFGLKKYTHLLSLCVQNPKKIFFIASFAVAAGIISLVLIPKGFINPDEAEETNICVVFPPGTLYEYIEETGKEISKNISALSSVKTVFGRAGAEEEDTAARADIDYVKEELVLRCVLNKGVKPQTALAEIEAYMNDAYEDLLFSVNLPKDKTEVLLGLSPEQTFTVAGKDREELSERIDFLNNKTGGALNFKPKGLRPELRIYPNREAAAYLSIPASHIAETLYVLNEGVTAAKLEIEGVEYNIRVTGQDGDAPHANAGARDSIRRLEQIPIITSQGKTVYLGSLCRIERKEADSSLARLNRSDILYADIPYEKSFLSSVNNLAAQYPWFAQADESVFNRYKNSLVLYVILVLILLYMIMGVQFESFLLPLILMLTIPFSLAGAGFALLITGSRIDSGAVLGLIALFGLVVNNSLILFEISHEKIRKGLPPFDAVCLGAADRFQAILITTLTTVFALLPLVLNPMSNSQKSMASAMLGGLVASVLLSYFAIPPVLIRFFNWTQKKEGLK